MRVVTFPLQQNDAIVYPAEGIGAFGRTYVVNGAVIGAYHGQASEEDLPTYTGAWPPTRLEYRTRLKPGEVMQLLGPAAFAGINGAAYPTDGSQPDANALYFLESAKYPYSPDGLLIVNEPPVTTAMDYFVGAGLITQEDADRVTAGTPVEVEL